ncbi:MAG TPA: hypothetical protein VMM59_00175 [Thermohalobaculum sp.]|nr:hypothetical protein [Thermohalobaculum sp.]
MVQSAQGSGQQALFGAAVPLARAIRLDRERLAAELREVVGLAGARVRMLEAPAPARRGLLGALGSQPDEVRCEIAGVRLTIQAAPRPLAKASVLHGFVNPAVWRGSLTGLAEHRAHVLIAELDRSGVASRDAMFDRATAVTLATAVVADLVGAEAVIWLAGRNAVPMSVFGAEMERFIDGQAPLRFWLRWQVLPPPVQAEHEFGKLTGEALNPGVATVGMTPFVGAEFVAPPSMCERDVMLDHVFELASAVIDENAELKDGAVYGKADDIMVRVNYRASGPYGSRPYWELLPRPAPAQRARPLFDTGGGGAADQPDQTDQPDQPDQPEQPDQTADPPGPGARLRLIVPGR